jgi:hypothetical protein
MLSVFGFVLAAPVAVQEVREVCADAVDGGNEMTIELGKRTGGKEEEESQLQLLGSTSMSNDESGTRPNPSISPGGNKPQLLSTQAELNCRGTQRARRM